MNVSEESGKNSDTERVRCHWVGKNCPHDLLYTVVLLESTFVQSSNRRNLNV